MKMIRTFKDRLRRDTEGAVAVVFALLLTVICGFVALAVDFGRLVAVTSRLEQTLNTAALAGAKMLDQDDASDSDITQRVTAFVNAQGPTLGIPPAVLATLSVSIDRGNSSVTANAQGNMATNFASVIGKATVGINKSATVVYKMKDVELAMVLDTTGSMADVPSSDTQPKIDSLKSAANIVVDTLYSQAINDRGIRIAIAPFSSGVNAGSYGSSTISGAGAICAVERLGTDNATDAGPYGADKLRDWSPLMSSGNTCPAASIIPLTGRGQINNIKSTINSFTAGGSTAGHIGAAWGWYMLSPNWNGIFTGSAQPGPYNDPNTSKNLVLMTDGLFNTSYLTGLAPGTAPATSESYGQFDTLCTNMKAQGINIYTIGFGLDDPNASTELSNCASSPANFFPVANGTQLHAAFATIVAKLNQLRISK